MHVEESHITVVLELLQVILLEFVEVWYGEIGEGLLQLLSGEAEFACVSAVIH